MKKTILVALLMVVCLVAVVAAETGFAVEVYPYTLQWFKPDQLDHSFNYTYGNGASAKSWFAPVKHFAVEAETSYFRYDIGQVVTSDFFATAKAMFLAENRYLLFKAGVGYGFLVEQVSAEDQDNVKETAMEMNHVVDLDVFLAFNFVENAGVHIGCSGKFIPQNTKEMTFYVLPYAGLNFQIGGNK